MGNLHIPLKALLKGLRLEVVPPPPVSKRTMELGVKYSPEFACLPLKINVGNFIEALEAGADTIIMAGGWGPCRFGYYAQVEREILADLGYEFDMVILEAPDSKFSELFKQIKSLGEKVSFFEAYQAVRYAWFKLQAVERLEKAFSYILPRVLDKNRAEAIYDGALEDIDSAEDKARVSQVEARALQQWNLLPQHQQPVLKIGLVGEIYTVLEPAANYHAIRCLGRLNAEVSNSIQISEWINDHILGGWIKKSRHEDISNCAFPYLAHAVGGHGLETVGCTVDFARRQFDGVIQIGPLTCMPEIVAQTILKRVSCEENIPCMTLYFDEHSGTAGVVTRLEAFVDMLQRKKHNHPKRSYC